MLRFEINDRHPSARKSVLTVHLARVQNKLNTQASRILRAGCGLSLVEWRIILMLQRRDGAGMSELAAEVLMDKGQLSRKINAMAEKGLVYSRADKTDNRKQHLHLTPSAQNIAKRMKPIMRKRQARLLEGVTPQELAVFYKVLGHIERGADNREVG